MRVRMNQLYAVHNGLAPQQHCLLQRKIRYYKSYNILCKSTNPTDTTKKMSESSVNHVYEIQKKQEETSYSNKV